MKHTEFEFFEVPISMPNGAKLYATGAFNISYTIQPPDRDVGIFRPYPEFDPLDDFVTITAFDDNALGEDDMRITLPWLSGRHPGNSDPLGQIWHAVHDRIEQHIMEIEDDE